MKTELPASTELSATLCTAWILYHALLLNCPQLNNAPCLANEATPWINLIGVLSFSHLLVKLADTLSAILVTKIRRAACARRKAKTSRVVKKLRAINEKNNP